ncbi:MAG: ImmA/IrrE family metallo-endopeptidase [Thermoguttaceae bacterium]|jgi:Zn-dependent peptidase ImmA (M78 family)
MQRSIGEEFGLEPGVEELSDGIEGMTFPDGHVLVSEETYRGAYEGQGRPRFTIPHECFHGIKHKDQIRRSLKDMGELVIYRRKLIKPFVDPEWQANAFAAAVLMPEPMVRMLAAKKGGIQLLDSMIKIFGVSPKAAEIRLEKLGI